MKTKEQIQNKVDNTFSAIDTIETVSVSQFFKDKTMQRLFSEKEEVTSVWPWFTPQLQLATLACITLLNVYAIQQINSSKYEQDISSFATDYGISTEKESSLFNL